MGILVFFKHKHIDIESQVHLKIKCKMYFLIAAKGPQYIE